jgi:hypothetical protein
VVGREGVEHALPEAGAKEGAVRLGQFLKRNPGQENLHVPRRSSRSAVTVGSAV